MINFSNNTFYIGTPIDTPIFEAIVVNDSTAKTKKLGLINLNELESTLSKKHTHKKSTVRTDVKSLKESKNKFGCDTNYINKKLKTADTQYEKKEFEDALKLYNSVLQINGIEKLLSKRSYCDILKYTHMCHAELVKGTKFPEEKQKWLLEGYKSLKKYLKNEKNLGVKSPIFEVFAIILYQSALGALGSDNKTSFNNLKLLLTLDLNSKELIQLDIFSGIIDDILYNMTVCIEKEEDNQDSTSIDMRMEMKGLLNHKLIDKEKQDFYHNWLDVGMEEEIILASLYQDAVKDNIVFAYLCDEESREEIDNREGPEVLNYIDLEGSESYEESNQVDTINSLTIEHILKRPRDGEDEPKQKKTKNI